MPLTAFDVDKPAQTETGTAFDDSIRANTRALWVYLIKGNAVGWTLSVVNGSGTAEEPQYKVWSNGVLRVRATYTYSTGYATSILKEYSDDSGTTPNATGTWSTIDTETATYDGSGNMTAGSNQSFASWLYEWIGKFKAQRTTVASHTASIATYGTMATQAASAVAITGGTVKGSAIGGTGGSEAALGTFLSVREKYLDVGSIGSGGTATCDLALAGHFRIAPAGNFTLAFSNVPTSGFSASVILELINCNGKTITLPGGGTWGSAGAPTFSTGTDLVQAVTRDGGSVWRFIFGFKG